AVLLDVADHSHYLNPSLAHVRGNSLSQCFLVSPETMGARTVNDNDGRSAGAVRFGELASFDDRNAKGRKIAGTHDAEVPDGYRGLVPSLAFDHEIVLHGH